MIDLKARERIVREREQKNTVSQLVASLRPIDKPDTMTEPLNKVVSGINRGGNISTILVAFVQGILKVIKEIKNSSPTSSDVQNIEKAIKNINIPDVEVPDTVTLNPIQHKEIVSTIKNINIPEIPEFPKKIDVGNDEINKRLFEILKYLEKNKITTVSGEVDVKHMPELNLMPLVKAIREIRVDVPVSNDKAVKIDISPILAALDELNENVIALTGTNNDDRMVGLLRQVYEGINSLVDKPTFVPPAVTHVHLNALQGVVKTTAVTVSTSATLLPSSNLDNRRAIQVFNNSSNTIYVGGSDVTTANGIPVLSGSFSQVFDMGYNMKLYGISASLSDTRVLEISDESSGR